MSEQYEYKIFSFNMCTSENRKNSELRMNRFGDEGWIFTPIEQTYFQDGDKNDLVMLGRRVKQQPARKIYDKV